MPKQYTLDNPPPKELNEEYQCALYSDTFDEYSNWCDSHPEYMEYLELELKEFNDHNELICNVDTDALYKSMFHRIEEIGDKELKNNAEKRFFIAEFTRSIFPNVVNGKMIHPTLCDDKRIKPLIEKYNMDGSGKYLIEHRYKRVYYIKKK